MSGTLRIAAAAEVYDSRMGAPTSILGLVRQSVRRADAAFL